MLISNEDFSVKILKMLTVKYFDRLNFISNACSRHMTSLGSIEQSTASETHQNIETGGGSDEGGQNGSGKPHRNNSRNSLASINSMNTTMTTMTNDHDSLNTTSNTLNTFLSDAASTDLVAKSSDDSEQFKIKNLDTGDVHDVRGKDSPESRKRPSVESSMKSPQTKFVRLTPVNSGSIISSSSFGSRASSDFSTSTMEVRSLRSSARFASF